jgi:aminoglycoside phosphotransferase (APT) family kinase protein
VQIDELVRPDALGTALADATGDSRWRDLTASLVAGGKSNLTFEINSPAGALIMRRPPAGPLLPRAHDMGREVRIQQALAPTVVPVARIVMQSGPDLIGAPFYVMEKVEGYVIREDLPEQFAGTPDAGRRVSFGMVDVLADLHSLDPQQLGLLDYGRPGGFVARQLRRFSDQWSRSKTREVKVVDQLHAALIRKVPAPTGYSVVHGDYKLDNCVIDSGDIGKLRAVLDWELSTLGDPMSDIGLMLFYWPEPGEPALSVVPSPSRTPGFPSRADLAEHYARRSGRDLGNVTFFEALAHFKFAVILQGIAARVSAGAMAGQDFGDLDAEVESIAARGIDRLREGAR